MPEGRAMNDRRTWFDDDAEPVLVVMPVHDDKPEPIELSRGDSATQRLIDFMASLPKEKCYVRKLCFMRLIGRDNRSFKELAEDAGIPKTTFMREFWRVDRLLRSRKG
jgi:hypothetical protein